MDNYEYAQNEPVAEEKDEVINEPEIKATVSLYTITPTTLVNLREGPSESAAVVAHATGGHVYTNVRKYDDEWFEIPYSPRYNLYAKSKFMKVVEVICK